MAENRVEQPASGPKGGCCHRCKPKVCEACPIQGGKDQQRGPGRRPAETAAEGRISWRPAPRKADI